MEYFELIRTIAFDMENGASTARFRIELFRSNINCNKYRAIPMEFTFFDLYQTFLNMGPQGEPMHRIHSSDSVWREWPIISDEEICMGYVAENEEAALNRAIKTLRADYEFAKSV